MVKETEPDPNIQTKTRARSIVISSTLAFGLVASAGLSGFAQFWASIQHLSQESQEVKGSAISSPAVPQWENQDSPDLAALTPTPADIVEANLNYDNADDPTISFVSARRTVGYDQPTPADHGYTLNLLDAKGAVLTTRVFAVPNSVADAPPLAGQVSNGVTTLPVVHFTLTLPWQDSGTQLAVRTEAGATVATQTLVGIQRTVPQPNYHSITGRSFLHPQPKTVGLRPSLGGLIPVANAQTATKALDITLVGNNYTADTLTTFHSDANRFISQLLAIEPFHSRVAQIVFHYVDNMTNLNCVHDSQMSRLIICDNTKVMQAVNNSGVPYDVVSVITNDPTYGGSGGSLSVSYNGSLGPLVFAHEFSHQLGGLTDEYNLYSTNGGVGNTVNGNCYSGTPPAAGWNTLVGLVDYAQGCNYPNWYRSSPSSLMLTLSSPYLNAVSQVMINKGITNFAGNYADTTNPTAVLTSPADGATLSGTVTVSDTVADNTGVVRAELWKDGHLYDTTYTAPYGLTWNTTNETGGSHTLQVKAYDAAGNVGSSSTITVLTPSGTGTGPGFDTTPPTVAIITPVAGATVTGVTTLTATATDNVLVTGVQFLLDGQNLGMEDTVAPYSVTWDSSTAVNGTHTLIAQAHDGSANVTMSDPVTITTSNTVALLINTLGAGPTATGVTFTWTTNVPSTGTFTLTTGQTVTDNTSTTNHTTILTGLKRNTKYTYTLSATSTSNGIASLTGSFRTKNR